MAIIETESAKADTLDYVDTDEYALFENARKAAELQKVVFIATRRYQAANSNDNDVVRSIDGIFYYKVGVTGSHHYYIGVSNLEKWICAEQKIDNTCMSRLCYKVDAWEKHYLGHF